MAQITLSPLDQKIAQFVCNGYNARDTGAEVGATKKSVEARIATLKQQFGCYNTPHLVAELFRNKLVV